MAVQFFFLERSVALANRTTLKNFIAQIFKKHRKRLDNLTYIFCSDDYLLEINRLHLKHDYYTDIITFDLSFDNAATTGEIYISVDRVKENAVSLGVTFKEELHRVMFHGALHLCGYKDKEPGDAKSMRHAEDSSLKQYFKKL